MAEIRDQYQLDIDDALRQIDEVGRRIGRALDTDFNLDFRGFDRVTSSLTDAERSAEALQTATRDTATAATSSERSYQALADALGISESRAAGLSSEAREAALASSSVEREARRIADSMGLSESETRQFVSALRQADTQAERVDSSVGRIGTSFGRIRNIALTAFGGFLGFQAVEGIFRGATSSIGAYADSVEEASKAQNVFGEAFGSVETFVSDANEALRATRTEALQATASFGAFFTGLGFGQSQAADLSTTIVQLGADFASFNNLDFTEALDKLRAGLAGEQEPLRQFGAGFNAAEVEARAFELGLQDVNGALDEQDKVLARLSIIQERTASAQGDAAETADQLAGRLRIVQARVAELAPAFGEALLPAIEALLDAAPQLIDSLELLVPVVADIATGFADAAPDIAEFLVGVPRRVEQSADALRVLGAVQQSQIAGFASYDEILGSVVDRLNIFGEIETRTVSEILGDVNDPIQIARAIQTVNNSIAEGLGNADAFGVVVADLAQSASLSADDIERLADAADLDQLDSQTIDGLIAGFDRLGSDALGGVDNLEAIQSALAAIRLGFINTEGPAISFIDSLARLNGITTDSDPFAGLAESASFTLTPLQELRRVSEDTGDSLLQMAEDAASVGGNLLEGLGPVDSIRGGLDLLAQTSEGAASRYREAFEVITETTNSDGETIGASLEETVAGFEEQAQRLAEFQASIAALGLLGFDDLAATLEAEGPGLLEQATGFLNDLDLAQQAEDALSGQSVDLSTPVFNALDTAISTGDFSIIGSDAMLEVLGGITDPNVIAQLQEGGNTALLDTQEFLARQGGPVDGFFDIGEDAGLGLAEGFQSARVQAAVAAAAGATAGKLANDVRNTLQVQSPSKVFMQIGEFAGEGLVLGFTKTANRRVPALTGVELPAFGGGGAVVAGAGTINNNVTNTVQLAESDSRFAAAIHAQQTASVGSALRSFSSGAIRV